MGRLELYPASAAMRRAAETNSYLEFLLPLWRYLRLRRQTLGTARKIVRLVASIPTIVHDFESADPEAR
jgi:hypothetical protein